MTSPMVLSDHEVQTVDGAAHWVFGRDGHDRARLPFRDEPAQLVRPDAAELERPVRAAHRRQPLEASALGREDPEDRVLDLARRVLLDGLGTPTDDAERK